MLVNMISIAITIICITLLIYMIWLAHYDHVTYERFYSEKITTPLYIFFIADIHRRKINHKTLDQIKESVDLVLIGGDLIERGVSFKKMRENLQILKKWGVPVYFVWGNNDYEVHVEKMEEVLKKEHINILKDSVVFIKKRNEQFQLIGLDYYGKKSEGPVINWEKVVDLHYTILLVHKPSNFNLLGPCEKAKIDLVVAGHTHGGQIRLFGQGFYTKGGLFRQNDTNIFITEGYGYTLLPFRLQTNAQCHLISILKKEVNN